MCVWKRVSPPHKESKVNSPLPFCFPLPVSISLSWPHYCQTRLEDNRHQRLLPMLVGFVWCVLSHIATDPHTHWGACMPDTPPTSCSPSLSDTYYTHTQRGSQWLWAAEPGVWRELKNRAQRKSEEHKKETMSGQGEQPRGCLSLRLWSRSPLLLLGLFSLQQHTSGELQQTFSTNCCSQHFGRFYLGCHAAVAH